MKTIVMSLGGSLVVPEEIDVRFLKEFRKFVLSQTDRGTRMVVVVGGGKVCRKYQQAASEVSRLDKEDIDWLGIHSTRLNAHLLRTIFRDHAHPRIIKNPTERIEFSEDILIAAGWKPGWSTDYVAVMLAKNLGSGQIINLSDIEYVYDKDPKDHGDARRFEKISWKEFRKIVGNKWDPGLSMPFDPVASRKAQSLGMQVLIANGRDLKNIEGFLKGRPFRGTLIS